MRALPGKEGRQPPGTGPVSREEAADDQRRRILEATAAIVAEHGYQEATIEAIVRRAKVGYATFYKHYPDREAAFLALVQEAMEAGVVAVEAAYERAEGEWPERLGAAMAVFFDLVSAHPDVARTVLLEALASSAEAAVIQEAVLRRAAELLRPGRQYAPDPDALPENLEEILLNGVVWVVGQQLIAGDREELKKLLPETLEFVLRPYVGQDVATRAASGVAAG